MRESETSYLVLEFRGSVAHQDQVVVLPVLEVVAAAVHPVRVAAGAAVPLLQEAGAVVAVPAVGVVRPLAEVVAVV